MSSTSRKQKLRGKLAKRDGNFCQHCGVANKFLTIDHVVPISKGGTGKQTNLQLLCEACHRIKDKCTRRFKKLFYHKFIFGRYTLYLTLKKDLT